MEELRFRQIHLDFHTSPHITGIGEEFQAEEFAETLANAHVDSITCFARCHHGMLYYKSKKYPERIHPHLVKKDMLEQMINACHAKGIKVPVYITVQWDAFTAKEHPEWLCIDPSGAPIDSHPYQAGFYDRLCVNSPYRKFLFEQTEEVLTLLPKLDGLFFDIVYPTDCSCVYCRAGMKEKGYDDYNPEQRMQYAIEMIDGFKRELSALVRSIKPSCTVFYNTSHIGVLQRPVRDAYTHFELESLPSGNWGYHHFPITMRYARTLGLDCMAHTGRFHTEWGDFHSFKNPAALEYECLRMLALNCKCLVGDQMVPSGQLNKPIYQVIGDVYEKVEQREPWCRKATAVTDIAVLHPEEFVGGGRAHMPDSIMGVEAMLDQLAQPFDILDTQSDFSSYKLLILPEEIPVDENLNQKLEEYLQAGGSVIATFESGMSPQKNAYGFTAAGIQLGIERRNLDGKPTRGELTTNNDYVDYIIPNAIIGKNLPQTEHVLYAQGLDIQADQAEVLLYNTQAYFDRNYKHYCSHRQTPSSGKRGAPAVTRNGKVIYFSHPLFTIYYNKGPRWCRELIGDAIDLLLPRPLIKHNGPTTMFVAANRQLECKRDILHLLHYIPERRCREIDIIEDIIPLHHVQVSYRITDSIQSVKLVPEGKPMAFKVENGYVHFTVDKINGSQMVEIQYL